MGENASKAKIFINCSQGNFQLLKVEKIDVKHDQKRSGTKSIGVDGYSGVRKETGGGNLNMEVYPEEGNPEVDWRKLFETEELFQMSIEYVNGRRTNYRRCIVENIPGEKIDTSGNLMMTVDVLFGRSNVA